MDNSSNSFLHGKIAPTLIKFSIPLMFSLILQGLYGAVDLMVVGAFGETSSVSAVATGSQIMHVITVIITGLTMGVTILIGQSIGLGDKKRTADIIGSQIKLFTVISIAITVIVLLFAEQIVSIMQVPQKAVDQTIEYIRICSCGMVLISAYNGISGIFRGIGNSKLPFIFVSIACVFNIVLDIVFVKFVGLDVAGTALATVIAQGVSVLFSVIYIKNANLPFKLTKDVIIKSKASSSILKLGSPIALQDFLVSLSFLIITAIVNSLGLAQSASVGVAEKMFVFLAIVPMSFMSALSAFVAQNVGAKNYARAKSSLKIAIGISFACGVIIFCLTFFCGEFLARIFERDDLEVIQMTTMYLRGCSFEHLFISISFCFLGYFNGMGKTTFVMAQGLISSFLVRIPLSLLFCNLENTNMFLISLAVPLSALSAFIMSICYLFYLRKKEL